jgi:hypothetical protein
MTTEDLEIIRRVAKIHGFFIRESNPDECQCFAIHSDTDIYRSDFVWFEDEGFDEFFKQIYQFGYETGYDNATECSW